MFSTRLVGLVIFLLGLAAAAFLAVQPFFPMLKANPAAMGIFFPAAVLFGLPLYASGDERASTLRHCGLILIGLGLLMLIAVFVAFAGMLPEGGSTFFLWFLSPLSLVSGLLLGFFAGALDRLAAKAPDEKPSQK